MPYTSEIEKLERRYAENPKGRNFAPLADAYRKAGQVDQAIELCKSGLERHPDYVSAHIVYGRCFIDQKNDGGAEQVFRKVLELDPENVIAFKVLAEIAAHSGRFADAVVWLTKLLAADPMNGDAAEALAVAKGKAAQSPPVAKPTAPASPAQGRSEATTAVIVKPDFVVEHTSVQPVTPAAAAPAPASDLETFDGTLDFNAVAHDAAKAEGLEVQEDVVLKPSDVVVEGLARTHYEGSGMFRLDAAAPAPGPEPEDDDLPTVDLPLIMPDDVAPARPPRRPTPPAPPRPPRPPPPPPPPRVSAPVAAAVTLSDDDGAADTATLSRAEPVLTETMAELYLRQGHQDDALRVYRALLAQRPTDARLRARVEALSSGGKGEGGRGTGGGGAPGQRGPTVQVFLRAILAGRPGTVAAPPGAITAVSPLDSAFGVANEAEAVAGQPTRAASDNISLDQIFGDDSGRPSSGAEAPAAVPSPAAPAPGQTTGFSFDEFFGSGGGPGPGAPPAATPSPAPARASGPRTKPLAEEDGDLDQFQAWLKGLKA